jgi:membrane protease YdiL (CAAX protease family)
VSAGARLWLSISARLGAAAAILAALPSLVEPSASTSTAVLAGAATAGALYGGLAVAPRLRSLGRARLAVAKAGIVCLRSASEEVIWRLLVLGALERAAGWPAALWLSTAGFAISHLPRGGEAVAVHAVTGTCFGVLYLATGRLAAPIAAHCLYNLLLLARSERDRR